MSAGASTSESWRSERRRFSAEEFVRMVDAGVFREEDRVELVRGEILQVTPQGPEHRGLKDDLHSRLDRAYREHDVHGLDQGPLRAGPLGLPEPDLALVRGRARDYLKRHPEASEALLVIEIAKTSPPAAAHPSTGFSISKRARSTCTPSQIANALATGGSSRSARTRRSLCPTSKRSGSSRACSPESAAAFRGLARSGGSAARRRSSARIVQKLPP